MFAAIMQKDVLGHNFLTKAHWMMILVSRVKESVGAIHFDDRSVCLSVCPPVCTSSPPSDHQSVGRSFSVFGWSADLSVDLSVRRPV